MTEQQRARASCRQKCLTCARIYGDGKIGAYNYEKSGDGWCRCYSLQQHAHLKVASNSDWTYCWNITSAWGKESTRPTIPSTHFMACQHVSQCNAVTRTELSPGASPLVLKSQKHNNKKRNRTNGSPLVLKSQKHHNKKRNRTDEQCTSGVSQTWWKEHRTKNIMGFPGVICDAYIKESK